MEETPSEKEDRLQRQEERLEKAHERVKEQRSLPKPSSGGGGGGLGSAMGGIAGFFGEHKIVMFAIGLTVVAVAVLYANRKSFSSSNAPSNQAPDWSQSGVAPSGIQFAFDQLTQQLNNIQSQLTGQENNANQQPPTQTPPPPAPNNNPPNPQIRDNGFVNKIVPQVPRPQPQFVTVQKWPDSMSTLSGIASQEHISLSRIESLNPNLFNQRPGSGWNLIYPGQRVRIS